MKKAFAIILINLNFFFSCSSGEECRDEQCKKSNYQNVKSDTIMDNQINAKNADAEVSCKLTSPELQKRKETVIANLKKQILERKELSNGYAYKFGGTDAIVDELAEFVKSERSCCSFFVFGLSFSGDGSEAWLSLTGPEGTKEMINTEIGL